VSLPKSRHSYTDCYEALDRAIADEKGVRIAVANYDAALHFRMRLHQARQIHRKDNELAYEPGHAMYGASIYDTLTVRIRQSASGTWIYIEKIDLNYDAIEMLSEVEEETFPALPPPPQLMIASRSMERLETVREPAPPQVVIRRRV